MNIGRQFRAIMTLLALGVGLELVSLKAQDVTPDGKKTLGIAAIKPTISLKSTVEKGSKSISMGRVIESLDSQLLDRINATRKFQIVAGSDLKQIIDKQDLAQSGNFDTNDRSLAQLFKLAGAKYYLITTVDDFEDVSIKEELKIQREIVHVRQIRLSAIGKIFDSTTGILLESANFQTSTNKAVTDFATVAVEGNRTDDLLVAIARDMADKIANRVADVVFPAKVMKKRDKQVTLNRGDGGGLAVGQVWNVFAVGEELIDPDTKEKLGREEVLVGKVKINQINPKFSIADVVEDAGGIAEGAVLRKPQ